MIKTRGIVLLLCIIVVMLLLSLYLGFSYKEGATAAPVPAVPAAVPASVPAKPAAPATDKCSTYSGNDKDVMKKNAGQSFNNCGNGNAKCNVNDFVKKNLIDAVAKSAGIDKDKDDCYIKFKAKPTTTKDNFFVSPNECECNSFGDKCTTKAINPNSNASFNVCYTKK